MLSAGPQSVPGVRQNSPALPLVCNEGYLVLSLKLFLLFYFKSASQTLNQQPLVTAIAQTRGSSDL